MRFIIAVLLTCASGEDTRYCRIAEFGLARDEAPAILRQPRLLKQTSKPLNVP